MKNALGVATGLEAEVDQLRREVALLQRGGLIRRVLGMAGVLVIASALGFGALKAAGVEAFEIDAQGNISILGAVLIGGPTRVGSLSSTGPVSGAAVTGETVTANGALAAGSVRTGGAVTAATVAANTVTAIDGMTAGTVTATGLLTAQAGLTSVGANNLSGVVIDAAGNMAVPGNLNVAGLNDRLHYESATVGVTTEINATDLARLCADGDGCQIRMAMVGYDPAGRAAPASYQSLLYCTDGCATWRTMGGLVAGSIQPQRTGADANIVVEHVLFLPEWSCYFTDGKYESVTVANDDAVGFGLLLWTEFPGSACSITIID